MHKYLLKLQKCFVEEKKSRNVAVAAVMVLMRCAAPHISVFRCL